MPGNQVKNWSIYHRLREKGYSKSSAARIANAVARRKRKKSVSSAIAKHYGPGPHKSGTPQSVHGGGGGTGATSSPGSPPSASSRVPVKIAYDREVCSRCGGTGNYSFNPIDGTTCFKCRGAGTQLTRQGSKAYKKIAEYKKEHFSYPAKDVKEGDWLYLSGGRRRMAMSDAKPDPLNPGFIRFDIKEGRNGYTSYGMGENAILQHLPSHEEFAQMVEFARGTPGLSIVPVEEIKKHYGPGPHANGTPQSIHGAGGGAAASIPASSTPKTSVPAPSTSGQPDGSKEHPYRTNDVKEAAALLARGKHVEFTQPKQVSTLIEKLGEVAREMEAKGKGAPNFDLCKVTVQGLNLFCVQNKGLHRIQMPQFSGVPVPGSQADQLPKDDRGEVDVGPAFVDFLKAQGISVTQESELASHLKASQMELVGKKVSGMMGAYRAGKLTEAPIFVSSDNYVIDGHHRWATIVGVDLADNKAGDLTMPITRVDMPVTELLFASKLFTTQIGIAPKVAKHMGPGPHPDGTPQSVHAGGHALPQRTATPRTKAPPPPTRRRGKKGGLGGALASPRLVAPTRPPEAPTSTKVQPPKPPAPPTIPPKKSGLDLLSITGRGKGAVYTYHEWDGKKRTSRSKISKMTVRKRINAVKALMREKYPDKIPGGLKIQYWLDWEKYKESVSLGRGNTYPLARYEPDEGKEGRIILSPSIAERFFYDDRYADISSYRVVAHELGHASSRLGDSGGLIGPETVLEEGMAEISSLQVFADKVDLSRYERDYAITDTENGHAVGLEALVRDSTYTARTGNLIMAAGEQTGWDRNKTKALLEHWWRNPDEFDKGYVRYEYLPHQVVTPEVQKAKRDAKTRANYESLIAKFPEHRDEYTRNMNDLINQPLVRPWQEQVTKNFQTALKHAKAAGVNTTRIKVHTRTADYNFGQEAGDPKRPKEVGDVQETATNSLLFWLLGGR